MKWTIRSWQNRKFGEEKRSKRMSVLVEHNHGEQLTTLSEDQRQMTTTTATTCPSPFVVDLCLSRTENIADGNWRRDDMHEEAKDAVDGADATRRMASETNKLRHGMAEVIMCGDAAAHAAWCCWPFTRQRRGIAAQAGLRQSTQSADKAARENR